ncbi:MAG: hypothetical protein US50_C0029G0001, partial [Candidatus Nomurabacteria bacterium GW2011_GWB1_37_5]
MDNSGLARILMSCKVYEVELSVVS